MVDTVSHRTILVALLGLVLAIPTRPAAAAAPSDTDHDRLSDAFETWVAGTDPRSADSDHDGIRDGIEDPDHDGLSNAGEELYGTDPHDADSDDDGTSDWDEDSDGDGVADGRRQDARPLPGNLLPTLARADDDLGLVYTRGCHALPTGVKVVTCTFRYGPAAGRPTVVLTGDSHAAHWFPAIDRIARHRGWRLITMTKSACPVADVTPFKADGTTPSADCATWHRAVRARIRQIHPDMVIASTLDSYVFVGATDKLSARSAALWQQGLVRSLRSFRASSPRVVMLGDIFHWGHPQFDCMTAHPGDLSRCAKRRDSTWGRFGQRRDQTAKRAAQLAHATFRPTRQIVCTYDPCPFVIDRYLVTRDGGHLTATYATMVWRALDRLIPGPEGHGQRASDLRSCACRGGPTTGVFAPMLNQRILPVALIALLTAAMMTVAPAVASADSDHITEQATVTYKLDRRHEQVTVSARFTITNRIPSTATVRYFIQDWGGIAVPSYAQDFRVTGRGVTASLRSRDDAFRYYVVHFPRILLGQSRSFTSTWTLPSRGANSSNPTRVTDAYSHFCWYGQPVDTGKVTAVLPREVEAETSGSDVRTSSQARSTTVSARQKTDLITFGACTDVYDRDLLLHKDFTSPAGHLVTVEGWPDDPTWLSDTASSVEFALTSLEGIVGAPIPGGRDILIREAAGNSLGGYGGYFDSNSSVIRVSEVADSPLLLAHEIAHSWFDFDHFGAPWLTEGLAEWAARAAVQVPCFEPSYPAKGSPTLGKWRYLGYKPSRSRSALVDYQYQASCAVMTQVADAIGPDRMRDVIGVLLDGRSPYDRLPEVRESTATPVPTLGPGSQAGPGQAASPSPTVTETAGPSWSSTPSSRIRTKPVDWRQWLDAVDEIGLTPAGVVGPSLGETLLTTHGIATTKQLRDREAARTAFHELQAAAPGGITPAFVRRLMDDWKFADAQDAIALAAPIAASLSASPLAGSDPTSEGWTTYENAKSKPDLQRVASPGG